MAEPSITLPPRLWNLLCSGLQCTGFWWLLIFLCAAAIDILIAILPHCIASSISTIRIPDLYTPGIHLRPFKVSFPLSAGLVARLLVFAKALSMVIASRLAVVLFLAVITWPVAAFRQWWHARLFRRYHRFWSNSATLATWSAQQSASSALHSLTPWPVNGNGHQAMFTNNGNLDKEAIRQYLEEYIVFVVGGDLQQRKRLVKSHRTLWHTDRPWSRNFPGDKRIFQDSAREVFSVLGEMGDELTRTGS